MEPPQPGSLIVKGDVMYKRIDVYLGMAVALLVFVVTVPVAQADFRLNCQDGNKRLHAPYSAADTDREQRTVSFTCSSTPSDDSNDDRRALAYAYVAGYCNEVAPQELRSLKVGQRTTVTCAETGETMAFTDSDGNQYALPNCVARVRKMPRDNSDFGAPKDWCYFGVSISGFGTAADKVN